MFLSCRSVGGEGGGGEESEKKSKECFCVIMNQYLRIMKAEISFKSIAVQDTASLKINNTS